MNPGSRGVFLAARSHAAFAKLFYETHAQPSLQSTVDVITGTVFRASRTNSCKGFNFLPDVVMSHKIEKKLENVLNITFLEKNHGVRVLSHNKGPHSVCKL